MVVCFSKLGEYGRLGNSIFQASCTIALALRNNDTYQFPSSWKYKNRFNLPDSCFVSKPQFSYIFEERHFHYAPLAYLPNLNLHGYFQSEKYFIDCKDEIKRLLKPKAIPAERRDIASIHVRRDDYLKYPNHHPLLDMSYYNDAMLLSGKDKFIVCSDDIAWCKQHFIGNKFEFSDNRDEVDDLALQLQCGANIIANSSFSWWGAWLNEYVNKKVIAPLKWFGPAIPHNTQDLIPQEWSRI